MGTIHFRGMHSALPPAVMMLLIGLVAGRKRRPSIALGSGSKDEGGLVERRIAPNRREIVAQPFFVVDELATSLFEIIELSVLPPERLPLRSELSKRLLDRRFELV